MKKIIIVGSSGFVGRSLNNFLNKKNYKIINFSRSNKKDILKVKKLPKSNYIIYCVKTNDIKKSLHLFKHFDNSGITLLLFQKQLLFLLQSSLLFNLVQELQLIFKIFELKNSEEYKYSMSSEISY